jgi:hypothetical protein
LYDGIFPTEELINVLGRDSFGLMRWSQVHKEIHPHCHFDSQDYWVGETRWQRTTLYTPVGSIFEERAFESTLNSSSIRKHFLQEKKDYEILWYYLNDSILLKDYDRYHQDQDELGEMGVPLVAVERTPYQQLWIIWAGLDNLSFHMADDPEMIEKTLEMLAHRERMLFDIVYHSPAVFVDFPDNITADAIGPQRFMKYCVPFYNELAEMLSDRGSYVFVHMDGNLKPLWQAIAQSKVDGIDSFSPAPDNDTTIHEAVSLWPGKRLFVNFPSSVHLRPPSDIYAQAGEILEAAGHTRMLQIQISENVPPFVWRTSIPPIIQAIEDFGTP